MEKERLAKWVGVDLDGTIAIHYWPHQGKYDPLRIGAPVPLMVERVKVLLARGTVVKIFTARVAPQVSAPGFHGNPPVELIHEAISAWTLKHVGVALEATCVKDYGMIALYDDRAYQVEKNTGLVVGLDV